MRCVKVCAHETNAQVDVYSISVPTLPESREYGKVGQDTKRIARWCSAVGQTRALCNRNKGHARVCAHATYETLIRDTATTDVVPKRIVTGERTLCVVDNQPWSCMGKRSSKLSLLFIARTNRESLAI